MSRFDEYLEAAKNIQHKFVKGNEAEFSFIRLKNSLKDSQAQGVKITREDIKNMVNECNLSTSDKKEMVEQLVNIFVTG